MKSDNQRSHRNQLLPPVVGILAFKLTPLKNDAPQYKNFEVNACIKKAASTFGTTTKCELANCYKKKKKLMIVF